MRDPECECAEAGLGSSLESSITVNSTVFWSKVGCAGAGRGSIPMTGTSRSSKKMEWYA